MSGRTNVCPFTRIILVKWFIVILDDDGIRTTYLTVIASPVPSHIMSCHVPISIRLNVKFVFIRLLKLNKYKTIRRERNAFRCPSSEWCWTDLASYGNFYGSSARRAGPAVCKVAALII